MLQSRCWKEKACWLVRIFIESFDVYKKFWRLNFQESYHFEDCLHFSIFKTFETSKHSIAILNGSNVSSVLRPSTCLTWPCLLPNVEWFISEKEVKGFSGVTQICYRWKILFPCMWTLAEFCILPNWLYREKWVLQSWQYFYAIGVSEWWVMESFDARRIHSKEKILFHAKNVFFVHILTDILFVYHYFALLLYALAK